MAAAMQRPGGGGAGNARPAGGGTLGGGAGMTRPAGGAGGGAGGMARPAGGGGLNLPNAGGGNAGRPSAAAPATRPNLGSPSMGTPNISRPSGGVGGALTRPAQAPNQPSGGNAAGGRPTAPGNNRPNLPGGANNTGTPSLGGLTRPATPGANNTGGNRPNIERPTPNRPGGEQAGGNRPNIERPTPNRPGGEQAGGNRPNIDRPNIDRPNIDRPNLTRPDGNRPGDGGNAIGGGNRPNIDRPNIDRPNIDRPNIDRPNIDRPNIDRPNVTRPDGNRPGAGGNATGGGNRPNNERPSIDRPNVARPDGNRPGAGDNAIGSGNRPTTRPGTGGLARPPVGDISNLLPDSRPDNISNWTRPNRPGNWNGGDWNSGNWNGGNWNGDNWNSGNWNGGNWNGGNWGNNSSWWINNNNFNNVNVNINNRPGWGGGFYGPGYFGPGWSGGYWGNWYHGSSFNNNFWGGFATGVATTWAANAIFRPRYTYAAYGYIPPAWNGFVYDSWGLNYMASDWMYAGYVNPYAMTPVTQTVIVQQPVIVEAGQPAATSEVVAYDYAKPIDVVNAPPEPELAAGAQQVFQDARDRFQVNDFEQALRLADQALVQLPNDPVLHEFRALSLFALGRYDEAAATAYAVLSAGPGWDWTTLAGLYGNTDTYTSQLRNLEAAVEQQPEAAPVNFLLAYHYLVQGHRNEAGEQFARVARLQPSDTVSTRLAKAFGALEAATPPTPGSPGAATRGSGEIETLPAEEGAPPPPPPAALQATWTAQPADGVTITLKLEESGVYSWKVSEAGRTQLIEGQAGYEDEVLVLSQEQGPPLVGRLTFSEDQKSFSFKPPGADENVEGLTFTKQ
jgi:tetratricopeptide (TPR) repeat protein